MSRLAGFLVVVLAATAFADTTEPPASPPKSEEATAQGSAKSSKFPLRVVKVLLDSEQALLFDKHRGRHILVELGEVVGDYTVTAIDEEEVTLTGKDLPVEVVLASPDSQAAAKQARKVKKAEAAAAAADSADGADEAPEDPYREDKRADAKKAPTDPYADESAEAREVGAEAAEVEPAPKTPSASTPADGPAKPGEAVAAEDEPAPKKPSTAVAADRPATRGEAIAAEDEPSPKKPSTPMADVGLAKGGEAVAAEDEPAPKPPRTAVTADGPTTLSKRAVTLALNDFALLAKSIDGSFTKTGLVLEKVAPGSVFAKAGLTVGDVVVDVDGRPLRTIDDAADLYARAGSMKHANVHIIRSGKPQTLRVVIQ